MTLESSDKKNFAVSLFVIVLGLFFIYLTSKNEPWIYDLNSKIERNQRYANLLGYLLLLIGLYSLIAFQKVTITIDEAKKQIHVRMSSILNSNATFISPFANVVKINTVKFGRSRQPFYMLVFIFNNRAQLRTNYWSHDEYVIKRLGAEISQIIGCASSDVPAPISDLETVEIALISFVLALATWALFYKIKFGATCAAMWFGAAPALVIGSAFIAYYRVIKKFKP